LVPVLYNLTLLGTLHNFKDRLQKVTRNITWGWKSLQRT